MNLAVIYGDMDSRVYVLILMLFTCLSDVVESQDVMNCEAAADIIFLVDSSLSIQEANPRDGSYDNWEIIKDFIGNLTFRLPVKDKISIGVLKFSNEVDRSNLIRLGDYDNSGDLQIKIKNLSFVGKGTNTSGAIWYAHESEHGYFRSNNDRNEAQNMAILITDGLANRDANYTRPYAQHARRAHGTKFFTIGITEYVNTDELEEIASDPVSYYTFLSKDFRNLNLLLDNLLSRLCRESAPPRAPCMDARADVAFLLDSSGSIGEPNWDTLKSFVVSVMMSLDLSGDRTRISVIRYSKTAEVIFYLDDYFGAKKKGASLSEMANEVKTLGYIGQQTNISGALKVMHQSVFTAEHGDRPGVQNIGILMGDGEATEDVNDTFVQATLVKSRGIRMFVLGLSSSIREMELTSIATEPIRDHYFNTTSVDQVPLLTSRLVYGLCDTPCIDTDKPDDLSCSRNVSLYGCQNGAQPQWVKYENHILLGHNYDRLENINTARECQEFCSRHKQCRSVDYLRELKQCALSYVNKDEKPQSFISEGKTDYYELSCPQTSDNKPDLTTVGPTRATVANGNPGVNGFTRQEAYKLVITLCFILAQL